MSRFAARASNRYRAVRNTCLLLLTCTLAAPLAHAGSGRAHDRQPQQFNLAACYQLVHHEGRMIAWARWEENFPLEKTRTGEFREDTPVWMIDIVHTWIADAYRWQATDEQVRQWAEELGNTDDLPSAARLTKHETIAIWMRRLARHCDSRQVQASAPEPEVARFAPDETGGN
jgi:hypothetical protein